MNNWIETAVKYTKTMENGITKQVTEKYLVDALSFTEAEARITEEMQSQISGDFQVSAVKQMKITELLENTDFAAGIWYKGILEYITYSEKTMNEKRQKIKFMVRASSFGEALKIINEYMGGTMIDYRVFSITETLILDVFKSNK